MASPARALLVLALLTLACSESGGGAKLGGMTGDDGAASPSGQGGAPSGTRGGGGGAFGGGHDPDAAAAPDAGDLEPDAPPVSADARPDLARDLPRDLTLTPVDAVLTVDSAAMLDVSANPCSGVCDQYEADYKAALARAKSCIPTSKLQCQMTAATGLGCAGCKVWVNSTTELTAIRAKWIDAGCQTCKMLCPQIACRALTTGVCHSKMLAAPGPDPIAPPPVTTGTCLDQSDPVPF